VFYQQTVLDNGITILTERMEAVRSVSLGIWFRVGSRDETPDQLGISHFLEHMSFKGTARRDALAISQDFESLGAEQNAFTSKEYTCYYARVIDERLPEAFDILADMVTGSLFEQSSINSEREVVIEEIARSEDNPEDYIFELFTSAVFAGHPLGEPVIGTRQIVGNFQHQDCASYHQQHYHAGNCFVIASGNVEHQALVELCLKHLEAMPPGRRNQRDTVPTLKRQHFTSLLKETEQAHLMYGMPGLSLSDEDRYAGNLLDSALGGGMSSRLFQEIREKRGLAYAVFAATMPYLGAGQFVVYVGTRPANAAEAVQIIQDELHKVLSEGLSADELERVREYVLGHIVLSNESTSSRMLRLGKSALAEQEILSLDELIERYRAVQLDDVQRVAERVLSQKPTLAIIRPRDDVALEELLHL
jgi:predicted Zn-dependent peptidase